MSFYGKKLDQSQFALEKAKKWIVNNTVGGGIVHSAKVLKPYPEVTGYYIPSLLKWGEIERAKMYGDWLLSIQTNEGAWQDVELKTIYTFDTGQILKGLHALIPYGEKYETAFLRGCDWLVTQIDEAGKIHTPTSSHFSAIGSDYIHLYVLEPLKNAAKQYNRKDYEDAVNRSEKYYLSQKDLTDFKMLSHFHAYIIEGLIDLGYPERALEALSLLDQHKTSSGVFPAFYNVSWVCLTAILQYAVCFYKLGLQEKGDRFLHYAIEKQNKTGGFYGGSGWFVTYFKNTEISWPLKYLLDALYFQDQLTSKNGSAIAKGHEDCSGSYAQHYLASHQIESARNYKLDYLPELIMDALAVSSQYSILYVGCGTAGFIKEFCNTDRFVGVDYSSKMIKNGLILVPVVNHKMSLAGKIKHAIKHMISQGNLTYSNIKATRLLLSKNKLKIQAVIQSASSYCDVYILKNA